METKCGSRCWGSIQISDLSDSNKVASLCKTHRVALGVELKGLDKESGKGSSRQAWIEATMSKQPALKVNPNKKRRSPAPAPVATFEAA